jgi:Mg/Co/Ni transporter MgtE
MLVGAGGNAGSQSVVLVVRGLSSGSIRPPGAGTGPGTPPASFILSQMRTAIGLSLVLCASAGFRALLFREEPNECLAIALSMFSIVLVSVLVGTCLPFALKLLGLDPAHASAAIQVLMDIIGVSLTCLISSVVLVNRVT